MKKQKEMFGTVVGTHVHLCLALSTLQTLCLDIGLCFVLQPEVTECSFSR